MCHSLAGAVCLDVVVWFRTFSAVVTEWNLICVRDEGGFSVVMAGFPQQLGALGYLLVSRHW